MSLNRELWQSLNKQGQLGNDQLQYWKQTFENWKYKRWYGFVIHKKLGVVNSYERPFKRENQTKNNGKPLGKFIISELFYFEKKNKVIKILSISDVNRPILYR